MAGRRLTWAFEQGVSGDAPAEELGVAAIDIVSRSALVSHNEKELGKKVEPRIRWIADGGEIRELRRQQAGQRG